MVFQSIRVSRRSFILMLGIVITLPSVASGQDQFQLLSNPTPTGVSQAASFGDGPYSQIATSGNVVVIATDYEATHLLDPVTYESRIIAIFRDSGDGYELEQTILPTIGFAEQSEVSIAVSGDHLAVHLLTEVDEETVSRVDMYAHANGKWVHFDTFGLGETGLNTDLEFAGEYLLIEGPDGKDGTGVYAIEDGSWSQVDLLVPNPLTRGPLAGSEQYCVMFTSDFPDSILRVAAIYELIDSKWTQVDEIIQPVDPEPSNGFGTDVAISGDRLVLSDPYSGSADDGYGTLFVYRRNATSGGWELEDELTVPGFERLGTSVDISGETIVALGRKFDDIEFAHFYFDGANWQLGYTYRCVVDCEDIVSHHLLDRVALEGTRLFATPFFEFAEVDYLAGTGAIGAAVTQDCNGNMFSDALEILFEVTADCNSNGVLDSCEDAETDCNGNGICDLVDIDGEPDADCNMNGIPDECESAADSDGDGVRDICDNCPGIANQNQRDCDGDGVGDVCAIAQGLAEDCNLDGVPDNCTQSYPPSPELPIGLIWWYLTQADGVTACIQPFTVRLNMEAISAIGVQWTFTVPSEARIFVMLDPTQDDDLSDAVIVRDVTTITPVETFGTVTALPARWANYDIEPTYVGELGETFYVGVLAVASRFPARDMSHDVQPDDGIFAFHYPNHFGLDFIDPVIDLIYLNPSAKVRWGIRATSTPVDCLCTADIADTSGPGTDDIVDEHDLIALLTEWGECAEPCPPQCAADLTGNCRVDVRDLLVLLAQWGLCGP